MNRQTFISKIIDKFDNGFNNAVKRYFPYMPNKIIHKYSPRTSYYPGLFTVLAYSDASKKDTIPRGLIDLSIELNFLHLSSILRDTLCLNYLDNDELLLSYQKLLFQLGCGSIGLGDTTSIGFKELIGNNGKRTIILENLNQLTEREMKSLNTKMELLDCIKRKCRPDISYENYITATASRVIKHAIIIGDSLSGSRTNSELSLAGERLSICFTAWYNATLITDFMNSENGKLNLFNAVPLLLELDFPKLIARFNGEYLPKRNFSDVSSIKKVRRTLDRIACLYYDEGVALLRDNYSKDSNVINYCDICKKYFREKGEQ